MRELRRIAEILADLTEIVRGFRYCSENGEDQKQVEECEEKIL